MIALLGLAVLVPGLFAQKPVGVKVAIDAGKPVRTMRSGIGASWHAIDATLPGRKEDGDSWSGSAWGAFPDPDDEARWQELYRHANWLGLDFCRVELEQRMYEPAKRQFSWDNREMRILYRILDWAERNGSDVFLQQMWSDVAWNAYPELAGDAVGRLRSAPYSIDEFAYGLAEMAAHLVRTKGYKCIRWLSINNEPGHGEFSWFQDGAMRPVSITPALQAVRRELDARQIDVPLAGPDWTDLPPLEPARIDFDPWIGAYDLHSYDAVFDTMGGSGYQLRAAVPRLEAWARWAHDRNKPFFLSELGTMGFGWGHDDTGPASYESGLKDASLVLRGINAGVDGFNRWSFVNRGDLDGQWQLLDTWDADAGRLLPAFRPRPNAYYLYGLLSRFSAKGSAVLPVRLDAPFGPHDRKLVAAALKSPSGQLTLYVLNETHRDVDAAVVFEGLQTVTVLHRYAITRQERDRADVQVGPGALFSLNASAAAFQDRVPGMSLVVYSTYKLGPGDPGIASEARD